MHCPRSRHESRAPDNAPSLQRTNPPEDSGRNSKTTARSSSPPPPKPTPTPCPPPGRRLAVRLQGPATATRRSLHRVTAAVYPGRICMSETFSRAVLHRSVTLHRTAPAHVCRRCSHIVPSCTRQRNQCTQLMRPRHTAYHAQTFINRETAAAAPPAIAVASRRSSYVTRETSSPAQDYR